MNDIKIGNCYFNPFLVPFKLLAANSVKRIDGANFDLAIVEFAYPREPKMSPVECFGMQTIEGWIKLEDTRIVSDADLRCLREYSDLPLKLSGSEWNAVEQLWFVYGNAGPKYTKGNHEFLKCHLDKRPERAGRHQPTKECIESFKRVLNGDYGMLSEGARSGLEEKRKMGDWLGKEKEDESVKTN